MALYYAKNIIICGIQQQKMSKSFIKDHVQYILLESICFKAVRIPNMYIPHRIGIAWSGCYVFKMGETK